MEFRIKRGFQRFLRPGSIGTRAPCTSKLAQPLAQPDPPVAHPHLAEVPKLGLPQWLDGLFHGKSLFFSGMVLGVPHFRKPPYQLHYDLFVLIFTYSWWLMSLDIGVCSERSTSDLYALTKEMCFSASHFNSLEFASV